MKLPELHIDLRRPIAFYPSIARLIGIKPCLLFCQLYYWSGKQSDADGWIYKTSDEIEEETCLTYEEQKTARKGLKSLGLMAERYARLEHRLYYKIDTQKMKDLLGQHVTKPLQPVRETLDGKEGKPSLDNIQRVRTESTVTGAAGGNPGIPILEAGLVSGTPPIAPPPSRKKPPANPDHVRFREWWIKAFDTKFRRPYAWTGRDGLALKGLLDAGITADRLIAVCSQCWNAQGSFYSQKLTTVYWLYSKINEIESELAPATNAQGPSAGVSAPGATWGRVRALEASQRVLQDKWGQIENQWEHIALRKEPLVSERKAVREQLSGVTGELELARKAMSINNV